MAGESYIAAREFEYLTARVVERRGCHHLKADRFDALREFVLENRSDDEDSPLELMHLCSPKGIGEAIQLRNYVGMIELRDGLQIEVLPKIDIDSSERDGDRRIFLEMLRELGADISFKALDSARLKSERMPLFEVFVGMFVAEASDLVRHGLRSTYVGRESEERFVRGKIDFAREAKSNPARSDRINVVYDEFLEDRPENRLVKTTLLYLGRKSKDAGNVRNIHRLLGAFDEVGISHNVEADFSRCVRNRSTIEYQSLINWCRVFLRHDSFSMFKGTNVASSLLFPMEKIFEDYVGAKLRRAGVPTGRLNRVVLQAKEEWLYDRRRVQLKPDILCECTGGRRVILDTKWKHVAGVHDLATSDLYQMYAYGKRYGTDNEYLQHVVLLYPWHKGVQPGLYKEVRHKSKDKVQVDVFFVELGAMAKSLDELLGLIEDPAALED